MIPSDALSLKRSVKNAEQQMSHFVTQHKLYSEIEKIMYQLRFCAQFEFAQT